MKKLAVVSLKETKNKAQEKFDSTFEIFLELPCRSTFITDLSNKIEIVPSMEVTVRSYECTTVGIVPSKKCASLENTRPLVPACV